MDGIDITDFSGTDQTINFEVALVAWSRADTNGFVSQLNVEGIVIGFGIDRQGPDPQFFAGADDAEGDFAAVGDQDFIEHGL
jgi:hypothetical protein